MTRAEEMAIIERVLAGETVEFEKLVLDNQKKIYNLAYKMTGNQEDAYDISQETFLKAYKTLANFRGESSFSSYLYKMTSNLCIDLIRRENRQSIKGSIVYLDDEENQKELEIPDIRYVPETEAERSELRAALKKCILELPEIYRQALLLRDVDGLSYAEISEILELEEGTIKSRISRARTRLIVLLKDCGNLFSDYTSKKQKGE